MTELSHEVRELIEQGRASDAPSLDDRTRIRRRLAAELGAGAFATAAVAGAVAGATQANALGRAVSGTTAWLRGAAALAAITGSAAVIYIVARPGFEQPAPAVAPAVAARAEPSKAASEAVPSARALVTQSSASALEATTVEPGDEGSVAAPPSSHGRRRRRSVVTPAPLPPASAPSDARAAQAGREPAAASTGLAPSSVTAELALLAQAQRALRAGDARGALAAAGRHAQAFPQGAMAEERVGIETLAHCMLGELPVASARAFLARAPSSPLAARVRRECGLE